MCKKIVAYFMCVMVLVTYFGMGSMQVTAKEVPVYTENNKVMTKAAENYANKYYKEMVDIIANEMQDEMGVSISDINHVKLGNPYYIYDVEEKEQNAEFYFPIYDKKEIILMMHVTCTEDGWTASMDTEYTYTLNQLEYGKEECVFYRVGDDVYAENGNQKVHMRGDGSNKSQFKNKDLKEKKEEIGQDKKKIVPVQFEESDSKDTRTGERTHSYATSIGRYLAMTDYYTGQGPYNLCWAACIATIHRYRNGNLAMTAEAIAISMGEDYDSSWYTGAKDPTILNAFHKYKLYYHFTSYTPSWNIIKKNIDKHYPISLTGYREVERYHTVLITAYNELANGSKYVKIWDPNDEDVQLLKYTDGYDICFESNGEYWWSTKAFIFYK